MLKRYSLFLLMFLCVSMAHAKLYSPTDPEVLEVKERIRLFRSAPSPENRFELAMSCAYYGFIEHGWYTLKKLPKSYAPEVVRKYELLTERYPNEWKYWFKLAFGYYFLDRREDAKACFLKVLELEPKQVWAMGFMGLLEGEEKHTKEAIAWCNRALAIDKDATAIHFLLAEGYRRSGNYMGMLGELMTVGRLKTKEKAHGLDFKGIY